MAQKGTEAQEQPPQMCHLPLQDTTSQGSTLKSGESVWAGQHQPPHPALLRSMTTWCPSPHPLVLFCTISILPTAAGSHV